jgi:hypothetical protein
MAGWQEMLGGRGSWRQCLVLHFILYTSAATVLHVVGADKHYGLSISLGEDMALIYSADLRSDPGSFYDIKNLSRQRGTVT